MKGNLFEHFFPNKFTRLLDYQLYCEQYPIDSCIYEKMILRGRNAELFIAVRAEGTKYVPIGHVLRMLMDELKL